MMLYKMQNSIFVAANSSLAQCPLSPLSPLALPRCHRWSHNTSLQRCNCRAQRGSTGATGAAAPLLHQALSRPTFACWVCWPATVPARPRKENSIISIDRCRIMYIYIYYIYTLYIDNCYSVYSNSSGPISIENCDAPPIIYQTLLQNATNVNAMLGQRQLLPEHEFVWAAVISSRIQPVQKSPRNFPSPYCTSCVDAEAAQGKQCQGL